MGTHKHEYVPIHAYTQTHKVQTKGSPQKKNPPKIGDLNCVTRTLLYVSFLSLLFCLQ